MLFPYLSWDTQVEVVHNSVPNRNWAVNVCVVGVFELEDDQ